MSEYDFARHKRWIDGSFKLANLHYGLKALIQGLGVIDGKLKNFDDEFCKTDTVDLDNYLNIGNSNENHAETLDHFTSSILWVFGCYEFLRTTNEAAVKMKQDENFIRKISELKREFAELRIPLAKFQPKGKHGGFNDSYASIIWDRAKGIGWQIDDKVEYRTDLSEKLLDYLESL